MNTGKQPRVITACTMLKRMLFRYQGLSEPPPTPARASPDVPPLPLAAGHVSAALVLGGMDCNGPSLYTVYPHGSTDSLPYVTMGSGSLAAMSVFESEFKPDMDVEAAKALVHAAIMAGINNDLGSGGSVDMMVIHADGNTPLRNYARPNERKYRKKGGYQFERGTAKVLSQSFTPSLSSLVTIETEVPLRTPPPPPPPRPTPLPPDKRTYLCAQRRIAIAQVTPAGGATAMQVG